MCVCGSVLFWLCMWLLFLRIHTVSASTAPPAEAELPSPEVPAPTPTPADQDKDKKDTKEEDTPVTPPVRNLAAGESLSTTQDTGVSSTIDSLDPGYGRSACGHLSRSLSVHGPGIEMSVFIS